MSSGEKSQHSQNPFSDLKELGNYQIREEVGHGGMGYVFKAEDKRTGETVALKVMAPNFSMDEGMARRFYREAAILKSLLHRGIVRILDVNMGNSPGYYVMEFINGRNISDELKGGAISLEQTVGMAWQVAEALGAAHRAGVIHRDIKPSNIMRDLTGTVKLTDFGIARVIDGADATKTGEFLGTPAYMSPEQILGKEIGTASDIYSFGVVMYEMLTGSVPFKSENPLDVMRMHVYEECSPPKDLNPHIPANVSRLVMRMLEKKKEKRISNPEAFETELKDCARLLHGDIVSMSAAAEVAERTLGEERKSHIKLGVILFMILGIFFFMMKSCTDMTSSAIKGISRWKESEGTR